MSKRRKSFSKRKQLVCPQFLKPLPAEVKVALPALAQLTRDTLRPVLKAAAAYLKGSAPAAGAAAAQAKALGMGVGDYGKLFAAVYLILRTAVRMRSTAKDVVGLSGLGLGEEVVADIVNVVKAQRSAIEDVATVSAPACPRLASTRWRVDVAISTSSLQKCLKPSVLMQLGLSDGKLKNFELPLEKFHELRFNVAKALRAVQDLEAHPLIRVINHVDAFERAELAKESAKK